QNRDLKREVDECKTKLKADKKIFYIINDLKKENTALKNEIKECNSMENEVLKKNFSNLLQEIERVKNEAAGRIHYLEDNNERLQQEVMEYKKSNQDLENEKTKEMNKDQINTKYAQELEKELNDIVKTYEKHKEDSDKLHSILKAENMALREDFERADIRSRDVIDSLNEQVRMLEKTVSTLKNNEYDINQRLKHISEDLATSKHLLNIYKNEIIDLKGSIRVYCRVRPALSNEDRYNFTVAENSVDIDGNKFLFDKIFDPTNLQEDIFGEVSFLIDSIFDGYNSCIFAYGQTGSGKTYTMEGPTNNIGIIPRSVDEIFRLREAHTENGWKVNITASYIEIYNESIRDLLSEPENESGIKYEIKHENEVTHIKNCKYIDINNRSEALALLSLANKHRSVGSTRCNDRSSRSHSVFTITVDMTSSGEHKKGTMNLIDLAGSERLSDSGSEGIRLKETQNINKSLSALGNVINALLRNEKHIPFRNSKLTYLMQNYLGGKARVLMFVNVSPELRHYNETLCSLRFASNVSECKLGQANKNAKKKI
ncbi:MAG: hypothetical protein ACRCSV_00845, partial [Chlamydiales bacterium]